MLQNANPQKTFETPLVEENSKIFSQLLLFFCLLPSLILGEVVKENSCTAELCKMEENSVEVKTIPMLFISHGAPNFVLQKNDPTKKYFEQLGDNIIKNYGKPKGILMVSAHWISNNAFELTSG